ncbi:twin transmembrane helix small protein [Rhodovulum sp. 12E13]|uniref:twin transmembrane helix small protein n=1 Tax=Rhodovulum sp. 12E13 TaxID=2203891 RepID=UPI000E174787|nr:twin transmembrane helix small protein [Rhodovulum sp. 12E13]RDC71584.1 twin transmembrane helix small protein [Rhodovulum sp. 12E13]
MPSDPVFILAAIATAAVAVILLIGIGGFARGGEFNKKHANKVMRWRIGAQAVAVVLILLVIYLRGGS